MSLDIVVDHHEAQSSSTEDHVEDSKAEKGNTLPVEKVEKSLNEHLEKSGVILDYHRNEAGSKSHDETQMLIAPLFSRIFERHPTKGSERGEDQRETR